jgi:hypothetical protein
VGPDEDSAGGVDGRPIGCEIFHSLGLDDETFGPLKAGLNVAITSFNRSPVLM